MFGPRLRWPMEHMMQAADGSVGALSVPAQPELLYVKIYNIMYLCLVVTIT